MRPAILSVVTIFLLALSCPSTAQGIYGESVPVSDPGLFHVELKGLEKTLGLDDSVSSKFLKLEKLDEAKASRLAGFWSRAAFFTHPQLFEAVERKLPETKSVDELMKRKTLHAQEIMRLHQWFYHKHLNEISSAVDRLLKIATKGEQGSAGNLLPAE